MFWNNQVGREREKGKRKRERARRKKRERKKSMSICVRSLNGENDCPFYLTPCVRETEESNDRSNSMFWVYIFIHLAGELVAFDTTTENYTVPVSGKCILTCYVAEVRSFKVSHLYSYEQI